MDSRKSEDFLTWVDTSDAFGLTLAPGKAGKDALLTFSFESDSVFTGCSDFQVSFHNEFKCSFRNGAYFIDFWVSRLVPGKPTWMNQAR